MVSLQTEIPSPVSVVQISHFQLGEADVERLSFGKLSNEPTDFDSVSTISYSDDSSLSDAECSEPRSIFKKYWERKGESPLIHRPSPACIVSSPLGSEDESSCANTYERVLKKNEGVRRRRSIFSNRCFNVSEPLLARHEPVPLAKRSASMPQMRRKPKSCLRPTRFSGEQRRTTIRRGSSVSFSSHIDVLSFKRPQENWAAEGWSNYFV